MNSELRSVGDSMIMHEHLLYCFPLHYILEFWFSTRYPCWDFHSECSSDGTQSPPCSLSHLQRREKYHWPMQTSMSFPQDSCNKFQNQSIGSKKTKPFQYQGWNNANANCCLLSICHTKFNIETYPNVLRSISVVMFSPSDLIFGALLRDFASITSHLCKHRSPISGSFWYN